MHNYVAVTNSKMRTGSPSKSKIFSLKDELKKLGVDKISRSSGFEKRRPKKIRSLKLIQGFYDCCFGNTFSLNNWAAHVGLYGKKISKQAVAGRINGNFLNMLEILICQGLAQKTKTKGQKLLDRFTNVYIQDSSCLGLPDWLREFFPGNYSFGNIKAVAKLQVIFNISKGIFSGIQLTAYNRNDQAASGDIIPLLKKGDLVIRDLGYFVLNVLKKIKEKQAHFVTRLRADVALFDPKNGGQLNLKRLLGKKTFLKRKLLVGTDEKMLVTLIAIRTNQQVHEYRKHKLIKDRDKRKKVTIEKLALLGWDIFICSMDDLSGKEIHEIYRTRWQIEIIFKSWKSHLKIEKNISRQLKKPQLLIAIIYLTLLIVILLIMPLYKILLLKTKNGISLMKLTQMLVQILSRENWEIKPSFIETLAYHTAYDKRKRVNMAQKIQLLT